MRQCKLLDKLDNVKIYPLSDLDDPHKLIKTISPHLPQILFLSPPSPCSSGNLLSSIATAVK